MFKFRGMPGTVNFTNKFVKKNNFYHQIFPVKTPGECRYFGDRQKSGLLILFYDIIFRICVGFDLRL